MEQDITKFLTQWMFYKESTLEIKYGHHLYDIPKGVLNIFHYNSCARIVCMMSVFIPSVHGDFKGVTFELLDQAVKEPKNVITSINLKETKMYAFIMNMYYFVPVLDFRHRIKIGVKITSDHIHLHEKVGTIHSYWSIEKLKIPLYYKPITLQPIEVTSLKSYRKFKTLKNMFIQQANKHKKVDLFAYTEEDK